MILESYPKPTSTKRLTFRPLLLEDAAQWQSFLEDQKATAHFPEFMKAKDHLRALHWIEKQLMRYRDKQGGLMAVMNKASNEFLGQAGLIIQHIDGQTELEVGYHLLPKFWGQGFATEAAKHFKELAFQISEVESVVSYIEKNNTASQKVAERNGMHISDQTRWKGLELLIYRVYRN